ncbi:hypothetical protein C9374_011648 [Naegleria lovaniensis]|uniref:RING-type domain-containing protein n=1 Tax=Naegleria lovaniensis TaxID=51637 RepID=A0AA88KDB7_NAELO|nr:uncharacterized protein C9374_011648 [Naegleria lovaniensis]KAG2373983.1 hypothetical protein C9374_011648 [Naegleria lovaniensis]
MFTINFNIYVPPSSMEPSSPHSPHFSQPPNANFFIPFFIPFFTSPQQSHPNATPHHSQYGSAFFDPQQFFQNLANQSFQNYQQDQINKKTPTTQRAIQELPNFTLTPFRKQIMNDQCCSCSEDASNTQSCAVCLCEFEEQEVLTRLPCGHVFHKDCIMPWIKDHNSCPTCRYELATEDPEREAARLKNMKDRFGGEHGWKVFEISNKIENVLNKVDEFVTNYQCKKQNQEHVTNENLEIQKNQDLRTLQRLDGELMNLTIELDNLEFQDNSWIKKQRKAQIVKIQSILRVLDQLKEEINKTTNRSL